MPACTRAIGSILNVVLMGENRIGMCHWCNAPFNEADPDSTRYPTRDHRIPKSRGGGTGLDGNLVWACRECNMLKADLMPDEFVEYMKIANDGVRHAVAYGLARNGVRYEEWMRDG